LRANGPHARPARPFGDHDDHDDVEDQQRDDAAQQREDRVPDPDECWVKVESISQARADAGEDAVVDGAVQTVVH